MHGHQMIILSHIPTPNSPKFLHMTPNTQKQPDMHTERPHIGTSFTGNPENAQSFLLIILDEFGLVDGPDSELSLHG